MFLHLEQVWLKLIVRMNTIWAPSGNEILHGYPKHYTDMYEEERMRYLHMMILTRI
jgi:hypothetical protein